MSVASRNVPCMCVMPEVEPLPDALPPVDRDEIDVRDHT